MDKENLILDSLKFDDEILNAEASNALNIACQCMVCNFELIDKDFEDYNCMFKHLAEVHHIIISNTDQIFNVSNYLSYWKRRLNENLDLKDICSVIQTNCKLTDPSPSEFFYVLCDILPEDKQLRDDLRNKELQRVLNHQKLEWMDTDTIDLCLFCNEKFQGKKLNLFKHMEEFHNFYIDAFENLVFTDELLNMLSHNLKNLTCLYCEKIFKSHPILKEHMRKKRHKRLRKSNIKYFKYLIPKYLPNSDKNIESDDSEGNLKDDDYQTDDSSAYSQNAVTNQEKEWTEWTDEEFASYVCLFCSFKSNDIIMHMEEKHSFNLNKIVCDESLTDYHIIKMINYIRRQTFQNICFFCRESFSSVNDLDSHFTETDHSSMRPKLLDFDQPQYFFPTYENDSLLCLVMSLRKINDSNTQEDISVFAETTIFDDKESFLATEAKLLCRT